jgi:hypothetical protein
MMKPTSPTLNISAALNMMAQGMICRGVSHR